jgi:hypothetical protein
VTASTKQSSCELTAPTLSTVTFDLDDGASAPSLAVDEFTCSQNCETSPEVVYELSVEPSASFITMIERTVDWSNANNDNVGTYTVSVVATVNNTETACNATSNFTLYIENNTSLIF